MHSHAIEAAKRDLVLTNEQREILFGVLLGDACLETQNRGRTYRLKIEQSESHNEYVQHLYGVFQPWVLSPPRVRSHSDSQGVQHNSCTFQTVSHAKLRFYAQQFYADAKKRVPKLIQRWLTPRGLAYWYMDDGSIKSKQSKGAIFNTQGFTLSDVERLIGVLQSKFDLQATLRTRRSQHQIYVSGRSCEQLCSLIRPYMIESMLYKLPDTE